MASLVILDSLHQALLTDAAAPLVLLGTASDEVVTLLGCARCEATATDLIDVADVLPVPLALQGAYAASREESIGIARAVQKLGFCAGACVAAFLEDGALRAASVRADGTVGPLLAVASLDSLDDWLKGCRMLRCELPIRLELVEDEATDFGTALAIASANIVRQLDAPGQLYLAETGPDGGSSGGRLLLRPDSDDLVEQLPGTLARGGGGRSSSMSIVQCRLLQDTASLAAPPAGLAFTFQPLAPARAGGGGGAGAAAGGAAGASKAVCKSAALRLDVLCFAPRRCTVRWAVAALTQGLVRQVNAAQRLLARQGKAVQVCAYHHLPPGLGHHLTVLYPSLMADAELNDLKLVPLRQRLHTLLRLPPNRPLLRPANALDPSAAGEGAGDEAGGAVARLRDVHAGLAAPGIGGTTALVQGSYEYCHYMQDRFNDSGWGCAYRSLQTICSWFRLQKYTSKPIPSHKAVQQVLANMGDKPPSFVGSSNWIGAIELSYILDVYLGVSCKIMTVNRGADIPSHARELAAHFGSVGSPVMIGGGVLAYTLLGVRFNEQTGEAAFLILDPHYTGGEDLKKVQQGTWVGWKRPGDAAAAGGPLFVADAFYNFLLPQRPSTV